jgi:hypothetical protein
MHVGKFMVRYDAIIQQMRKLKVKKMPRQAWTYRAARRAVAKIKMREQKRAHHA